MKKSPKLNGANSALDLTKVKSQITIEEPVTFTGMMLTHLTNIFTSKATTKENVELPKPLYGASKYSSFAKTKPSQNSENKQDTDPDCKPEESMTPPRQLVMKSPEVSKPKGHTFYTSPPCLNTASLQCSAIKEGQNRPRDINQMLPNSQFSRFNAADCDEDIVRKTRQKKASPSQPQSKLTIPSSPPKTISVSNNPHQDTSVSPTKLSCLLKPKARGPSTASHRSGTMLFQCINTENSV